MRLTTEEKRQLVMRYQAGEIVASICADTGIARSTLYSWIKSFHVVKFRTLTFWSFVDFRPLVSLHRSFRKVDLSSALPSVEKA